MEVVERHFRVMASEAVVILNGGDVATAGAAEQRLRFLEASWSRFLPESDITHLNDAGGAFVDVQPETVQPIRVMIEAWEFTAGRYDPTLLPNLICAGYISSIDDPSRRTRLNALTRSGPLSAIELDMQHSRVRIPAELSLDAGGIGKGFAGDLVVAEMLARGVPGVLVSIGGDVVVGGEPPELAGWSVGVQNPFRPSEDLVTLLVRSGAVCTSSTQSRRWISDGLEMHHLIDPATGIPSTSSLATVTAVASAGWIAEAHAKAALLEGDPDAIRWLDSHGVAGVVVRHDGTFVQSSALTTATTIGAQI